MSRAEIEKITTLPYAAWVEPADERQIVLSSRLRLARNLAGRPFPNRLQDAEADALAQEICEQLQAGAAAEAWQVLRLEDLLQAEKGVLLEKHLLSQDILQHPAGRRLVVNQAQSLAVMINEEDHLRMQAILPGLQLAAGWQQISALDDKLALGLNFAYDQQLGFLTSCPSNLGTGLRASVMLHLPALHMTNKLEGIFRQLPQVGLTVRGVYGEGSQSQSELFQPNHLGLQRGGNHQPLAAVGGGNHCSGGASARMVAPKPPAVAARPHWPGGRHFGQRLPANFRRGDGAHLHPAAGPGNGFVSAALAN